jgi:diadenylate cyclase
MPFTALDVLDIIIVSYVIYKLMSILQGTRAASIIKGLLVLFLAYGLSRLLGLRVVTWLLDKGTTVITVALPIVFYPELRRTLEHLGRGPLFHRFDSLGKEDIDKLIEEIIRAVRQMAIKQMGALIVLERDVGLGEYIETGVKLEALVSAELITNIFTYNTPLHDGAIIIRGDRIVAAGCFLPLSDRSDLASDIGTRHRAGLGVTEHSDCMVIIVSEETGNVSIAQDGRLQIGVSDEDLRKALRKDVSEVKHNLRWGGE